MWNSGQYFSGSRNALSQETSAEDAERYRLNVRNAELTDEEMQSTVHSSSEDVIAETTTTLDELANLENAKSRSEQYHTEEQQTVTPVEHAKSSSEKHYASEQQTVAPVEQSITESTVEENVGEFDDEGDTAEPSTTLSTILSVHHHTSYTPPATSEELTTYSEDESSTLRSTTAAHVPSDDHLTTLSELHDDLSTVAPTEVQDEQYSTTESLLDSRERFTVSSEQESREQLPSSVQESFVESSTSPFEQEEEEKQEEEEGEEEEEEDASTIALKQETEYLITPAEEKETWHSTAVSETETDEQATTPDYVDSEGFTKDEESDSTEPSTTIKRNEVSSSSVEPTNESEAKFTKISDVGEEVLTEAEFTTPEPSTVSATRRIVLGGIKDDISYEEEGEMDVADEDEQEEHLHSTTEAITSEGATVTITHYDAKIVTIPAPSNLLDSQETGEDSSYEQVTTFSTPFEPTVTDEERESFTTEQSSLEEFSENSAQNSAEFGNEMYTEQQAGISGDNSYTNHPKHLFDNTEQTTPAQRMFDGIVDEQYEKDEKHNSDLFAEKISSEDVDSTEADNEVGNNYFGEISEKSMPDEATVIPEETTAQTEHMSTVDLTGQTTLPPPNHDSFAVTPLEIKAATSLEDDEEGTTVRTIAETVAIRELITHEDMPSTVEQVTRMPTTIRVPHYRTTLHTAGQGTHLSAEKSGISTRKNSRKTKRIDEDEKPRGALVPWWLVTIGGLVTALVIGGVTYKFISNRGKPGRRSTATATGQEMTPLKKPDEENGVQSGTEA